MFIKVCDRGSKIVFHCVIQHSLHFKINIDIYKLNIFKFWILDNFCCSWLHIYCTCIKNFFFTGMIEKAGQDNNRNQKDSTNRKSVVVVDDDAPAQQKSGCCWHCCHSDANFFSPKRKNKQASSLDGTFK